jgi:long-chain acyl-CoA synthetase
MLNLSILLEDSARTFGGRTAVVLGESRLTYAQVDAAAGQVANSRSSTTASSRPAPSSSR